MSERPLYQYLAAVPEFHPLGNNASRSVGNLMQFSILINVGRIVFSYQYVSTGFEKTPYLFVILDGCRFSDRKVIGAEAENVQTVVCPYIEPVII